MENIEAMSLWFGQEHSEECLCPFEFDLDDPMLEHLSNEDICTLEDGYDDPRVSELISAYIELRSMMRGLQK